MTRYIDADETLNDIFERHCKECISRKGMKNGKLRVLYDIGDAPCRACLIDDMKTMIEDTPTVEVEPIRHGEWIDEGYYADYTNVSAWRCSECGWHMIGYDHELFRYCPSCGAKMEKK